MARLPLSEVRKRITEAIEQRRYDDAAASARVIIQAYPKSVQAHRMLGEALWEAGRPEEAAEAFRRVLDYDPEDFVAYAGLALIAEQQGQLDKAISLLQMATDLAPNSEEVRGELLRLHEKRGMADSARLKISRAALARIYARGEMPSRAVSEFRSVLDDSPDRHDVRLGLAEALWRDGDTNGARECAETVLRYYPDCLKANLIAAAVARQEGREQNLQQLLAQAVGTDPLAEMAERLFGSDSPLPPTDPLLDLPDYLLGQPPAAAASRLDIELPDWLIAPADEDTKDAAGTVPPVAVVDEEPTVDAPAADGAEDTLAWLEDLRRSFPEETEVAKAREAEAPQGGIDMSAAWEAYQRDDLAAALNVYQGAVEAEQGLDEAIQALAVIASDTGDLDATELLGDAYLRAGHYRAAMESYQRVLDSSEGQH